MGGYDVFAANGRNPESQVRHRAEAQSAETQPNRPRVTPPPTDRTLSSALARSLQRMDSGFATRPAEESEKQGSIRFLSNEPVRPPKNSAGPLPAPKAKGVTAIYRVRASGTRAEGFVAPTKKSSVLLKETPQAYTAALPAAGNSPRPRTVVSTRAIPRPASAILRSIQAVVSVKAETLSPGVPAKLLETGFASFLGGQIGTHKFFRFFGQIVLPLPQQITAWTVPPPSILQVKIKAIFLQALYPFLYRNRQEQPLSSYFRMVLKGLMRRAGASSRGDRRHFLRSLLRRRLRKHWLHKLNKKKVRSITTNISRAAGRTKTADLKDYY